MALAVSVLGYTVFLPASAYAAISFDAAGSAQGTGSSLNLSHTIGGAESVLTVCVQVNSSGATATVSGVVYNGEAMTQSVVENDAVELEARLYEFYLVDPTVGTANAVITLSGSGNILGTSASYFGVDQADPVGGTGGDQDSTTSSIVNITTDATNSQVVGCTATNGRNPSPDSATQRAEILSGASGHYLNMADELVAAAGATTMDWTNAGGASAWLAVATELHEAAGVDPDDNIGGATSTVEQTQANLSTAFFVFFLSLFGTIWILRKH